MPSTTAQSADRSTEPSSAGGVPTARKTIRDFAAAAARSVVKCSLPRGHVPRDDFGQPRLVDRDVPPVENVDLLPVAIDANHVVAGLGQASARDQSHIPGADDGNFHD